MALRVAIANGNWSNPSTWYLGVKPTAADIAASNGFTVTIDENFTVDSITNSAQSPVSIVPLMTSSTTPSGVVVVSSQEPSTYNAWKAFDGSLVFNHRWANNRSFSPETLEYQFPTAKTVVAYLIQETPTDWQFQAWNGSTWVVLDSVSGATVGSTVSRSFANTTAYTRYRLFITAPLSFYLAELRMFEVAADAGIAVAGGGFVLNSGVTTTLTNTTGGIVAGPTNCVTYSAASGTSTINGIVRGSSTNGSVYGINYIGAANLNINGAITSGPTGNTAAFPMVKSGTGTLTIVGNVTAVVGTNAGTAIYNSGTGTINITGNVYGNNDSGYGHAIQNLANCTINITGNVYGGNNNAGNCIGLYNQSISTINIVGNVYGSINNQGVYTNSAGSLSIVGSLIAGTGQPAVFSGNSSAINLFTGPFVCSTYGFFPYQVTRMHLIPTTNSYIEFRDETTNGAVSPGAIAPATQLVSPATLVNNLATSDVRYGTSYALGTLTGTLRMPTATQVTSGIQVDNTFGSAVLTIDGIWNYLVTNINTPDSIGMRLKNVSTPQTTGEQLEAFLKLD